MLITDTTNLKVGDFVKIGKYGEWWYYTVESITNINEFIVTGITHTYTGPMNMKFIQECDTIIMTEEEVSILLLSL